ncbi:MAG TPA: 6-phosphogluconolactonase [Candidatus Saccharimonadales bacterium]|nr:6-phosphogluconolactonase [Candidatus Saccharimonadales bacterium]
MQFVRADAGEGIVKLSSMLDERLGEGQQVLWLVPGGSNIPHVVKVMTALPDGHTKHLTILPGDERYGPVGHLNSNVKQLYDAGFDPKHAKFIPILHDKPLDETTRVFEETAGKLFAASDVVIGQFGIGPDGHIAAILPHSAGATALGELAVDYETPGAFTRITLTFPALRRVQTAFVFAYGESKRSTLTQLRDETMPLDIQPAQILKAIPEVYIYNDQVA